MFTSHHIATWVGKGLRLLLIHISLRAHANICLAGLNSGPKWSLQRVKISSALPCYWWLWDGKWWHSNGNRCRQLSPANKVPHHRIKILIDLTFLDSIINIKLTCAFINRSAFVRKDFLLEREVFCLKDFFKNLFICCIFTWRAHALQCNHAHTCTHVQTCLLILSTPAQNHLVEQSDLVLPEPFSHPQCPHTYTQILTNSAHTTLAS